MERIVKIDPLTEVRLKLRESRYILERTYPEEPEFEAQVRNIIRNEKKLKELENDNQKRPINIQLHQRRD